LDGGYLDKQHLFTAIFLRVRIFSFLGEVDKIMSQTKNDTI